MGAIRIGISGWTYPPWRGRFYPKGWPQHRELEYAASQVSSIEINGSFYSLQRPENYLAWYEATPDGFVFSIKGSRFITHMKRLKDVETPLANFFASGVLRLAHKLGPFLWQLPPSFRFDPERLERFLSLLPRDTRAAAALARKHDERLDGRAWTRTDCVRPLRHALEVRHSSFETPEFIALLREHDIAMVVADTAGKWPLIEDVTSDFVYVRLHGDEELYVSGYTPEALSMWAQKVRAWAEGKSPAAARLLTRRQTTEGRDVFVYFDNDAKVHAPFDAMSLAHALKLGRAPTRAPDFSKIKEGARRTWPVVPLRWRQAAPSPD
ncbi:MAG: hypothetical protein QOE70_5465 [Chthoniobacter sp.]|jgi:uncharacterized protein YecE (DUF72 family)|nr:hypothetical protein [Chthoniobacter sp.]